MSTTGKQLKHLYSSFVKVNEKKRIHIVSNIIDIELDILNKKQCLPRYMNAYLSRELLLMKRILLIGKTSRYKEQYLQICKENYYRYLRILNGK